MKENNKLQKEVIYRTETPTILQIQQITENTAYKLLNLLKNKSRESQEIKCY